MGLSQSASPLTSERLVNERPAATAGCGEPRRHCEDSISLDGLVSYAKRGEIGYWAHPMRGAGPW
jgi:hypothetical protein